MPTASTPTSTMTPSTWVRAYRGYPYAPTPIDDTFKPFTTFHFHYGHIFHLGSVRIGVSGTRLPHHTSTPLTAFDVEHAQERARPA